MGDAGVRGWMQRFDAADVVLLERGGGEYEVLKAPSPHPRRVTASMLAPLQARYDVAIFRSLTEVRFTETPTEPPPTTLIAPEGTVGMISDPTSDADGVEA